MMRNVPVYLFTGFMDSGKTTTISETLIEQNFADGRCLIIACEDGEEEYDTDKLAEACHGNGVVVLLDSEDELCPDVLNQLDSEYKPQQVFVEYNGTWEVSKFLEMELPKGWEIVQKLATVDASTFDLYLTNMRTMIMEQVAMADVVIFNRCDDSTDKGRYRRIIKANNRPAQIVYERTDGTIDQDALEDLPYDINQDSLVITDVDYGIFYIDIQDDTKKYEGKRVEFLAQVYRPEEKFGTKPLFVGGRFAMTCCVEDIQFIGFKCKYADAAQIKHKDYVYIKAIVHYEFAKEYRGRGPVLYVEEATKTDPPADSLIYFS